MPHGKLWWFEFALILCIGAMCFIAGWWIGGAA